MSITYVQGGDLYKVIQSVLKENEAALKGVTQLAKGAELTIKTVETYSNIREYFSKVLLQASKDAKTIAENAEHLIPKELINPETVQEARRNIEEAVEIMFEKGGSDNPELLQLARINKGQLPPPPENSQ